MRDSMFSFLFKDIILNIFGCQKFYSKSGEFDSNKNFNKGLLEDIYILYLSIISDKREIQDCNNLLHLVFPINNDIREFELIHLTAPTPSLKIKQD
jgi:hypothetical protein